MQELNFLDESATGGPSLKHAKRRNGGYWGWIRSRLAVWQLLPALCTPRASTNPSFFCVPERLLQRLPPSQNAVENRPEPAKQLIATQPRVEMRDLHTSGSHPTGKLEICAGPEAPGHHRGSPSCARRAGAESASGLVGRTGALKSCPNARGRADLPDMPNQPAGLCVCVAPLRAGGRAQQGARWPAALCQRSPRTFHLHPDPGRPLLNLHLCLRNSRPAR